MAVLKHLELLAAEAISVAQSKCCGGYPNSSDCSWYHGAWPALRVLGLVSNPYWHWHFFKNTLLEASSAVDNPRVLIFGTADFSMPFLVSETIEAEVVVGDVCKTPLELSDRVSKVLGLNWSTKQFDARTPPSGLASFDIIIMDAFLTRFDASDKRAVLQAAHSLLNTGGRVITTTRVNVLDGVDNTVGQSAAYQSSASRRDWFVERAISRAHERGGLLGISVDELKNLAINFMQEMKSYRFENPGEVKLLFEQCGFDVNKMEPVVVPGESEETAYLRLSGIRR